MSLKQLKKKNLHYHTVKPCSKPDLNLSARAHRWWQWLLPSLCLSHWIQQLHKTPSGGQECHAITKSLAFVNVLLCRWTTTCQRRLWCIVTVCQTVSWGWLSSTRSHSWSNALRLSPPMSPSWSSLWSKSASAPPSTPACPTTLGPHLQEQSWITRWPRETGQS